LSPKGKNPNFPPMKRHLVHTILLLALAAGGCRNAAPELPNILWITSEDNMPMLGCYGDTFATTPNLDQLAAEGFRYTRAYANTPVCAPARNTILTGVLACSSGNEQMRSRYAKSDKLIPYPLYLRELGYYCTNNVKTDYNYAGADPDAIWDECSNKAHYRNRAEGQPFFAVFNTTISHESSIHQTVPDSLLRHRPEDVSLPPYHPPTREMKHDWAQYYDKVEDMDSWVGGVLQELEEAGLAENTIVFYYSDHGGVLGRSKRYLYETGTRVPLIVRIPKKYRHLYPAEATGKAVDRLVSFVDLAPTLLSLTGVDPPAYMQGHAFLGMHASPEPPYVYMFRDRMDGRYDMSRSITDGEFRYVRHFNPHRIYLQHLNYLWRAPSMRSWEKAYLDGRCNTLQSRYWETKPVEELYDSRNDPWEVNNLAGDTDHAGRLETMRMACREMASGLPDAGFIPEADRNMRTPGTAIYDFIRSGQAPLAEIMEAAWLASESDPSNLDQLAAGLEHGDPAVRYWSATGLLLLGDNSLPVIVKLREAAFDPSPDVCVPAAELLYQLGEKETARESFRMVLGSGQEMARTRALNSIDCLDMTQNEMMEPCLEVLRQRGTEGYDARVIQWLFDKWGVDPADHGIVLG